MNMQDEQDAVLLMDLIKRKKELETKRKELEFVLLEISKELESSLLEISKEEKAIEKRRMELE